MSDWIHHKFLKLYFLRKFRSYVATTRKNAKAYSRKLGKCIAGSPLNCVQNRMFCKSYKCIAG